MNEPSSATGVSVIIVSWNARDHLVRCLESLTPEVSRYDLEIIVVDNGSTDGSPERVEADWPNVRLIRNRENLGFARANNQGIAQSTGRYLCLINSDVRVLKNCITELVDFCAKHPDVGMAGPQIIGGDGATQRSCRGFPNLWNMLCRALALDTTFPHLRWFTGYSLTHWPQDSCQAVDILTGCFWLIPRKALEQTGLLDETFFMYGEDMDWCRRFWNKGWKVMFVPTATAIHYGGASSANAPVRFFVEMQKGDLQYWKKHRTPFACGCFRLILCLHMILRTVAYGSLKLVSRANSSSRQHKVRRSLVCLRWLIADRTTS